MNKNLVLIATLMAVSLSWVGCNKSGKLAKHSEFKPPSGPVELKLKWPVGERIVQETDMKMEMEIAVPGQPTPLKQETTMGQGYGLTVLQNIPDGGHEVEMDFLSARMSSKMGDKTLLDYDSTKKSADPANPVADMFGKIVGSKIEFYLDASNAVERIDGVEALVNRLTTGGQADSLATLKSMFSEGYFKQMMSANQFMPPNAVQPGDTWPVRMEVPMAELGTLVMDYTFTFQSWETHGERSCARLDFSGTIQTKLGSTIKTGGVSVSISDGTTDGSSWFDPELGITIDTKMNQVMKMVIHMPKSPYAKPGAVAPGAATQMQSITNQMNQVINIKLVSVK